MTPSVSHGAVGRTLLAGAFVLIAVAACGGSMSANEYVQGLNSLIETTAPELDASVAAYEQIVNPTMADWVAFVDREVAIRRVFGDGFEALDPPDSLVDVHRILEELVARGLVAAEGLIPVADTVSSPEEAEQTAEFAEYQAANTDGTRRACLEVHAKLDDLATGPSIDNSWFPDLRLTVRSILGDAAGCREIETG